MRKVLLAACAVGALAIPATSAAASDIPQPAGTKPCPAGFTGVVVWVNTQPTGYREESFCLHAGPGATVADAESARAGVTRCGALGHYIVWYYDLNNEYRELWNSCI